MLRTLLDLGQLAMIGKGQRSDEVKEAVVRNGAVYLAAIGGAAALMARQIKSAEVIAFDDPGSRGCPQAVRRGPAADGGAGLRRWRSVQAGT